MDFLMILILLFVILLQISIISNISDINDNLLDFEKSLREREKL